MSNSVLYQPPRLATHDGSKPDHEPGTGNHPESPQGHTEEEALGLVDPYLDSLLRAPIDDGDEDGTALAPAADIAPPPLAIPRDLGDSDSEQDAIFVPIEIADSDERSIGRDDDEQGPDFLEPLVVPEAADTVMADGAEEGPTETHFNLEPQAAVGLTDHDDSDVEDAELAVGLHVDDTELPWAKERWTERVLGQTFSARCHLALIGSTLAAVGERAHLQDTRSDCVLEELPITGRTTQVLALDPDAKELMLLTATGQLLIYNRQAGDVPSRQIRQVTQSMVSDVWQLSPGVPVLLVRTENGQLHRFVDGTLKPSELGSDLEGARLLALSHLGEPRVALWRSGPQLFFCLDASGSTERIAAPDALVRAATQTRLSLLGFNESVLVSARGHGLWLHRTGQPGYLPVLGCREITAVTAGRFTGRPVAFVGLYHELEDRAEIAMVDLATGRAARITELHVHSDICGPEDDPPELARIDALLWDPNQGQLWAAGGFGLARFAPPLSPRSS